MLKIAFDAGFTEGIKIYFTTFKAGVGGRPAAIPGKVLLLALVIIQLGVVIIFTMLKNI